MNCNERLRNVIFRDFKNNILICYYIPKDLNCIIFSCYLRIFYELNICFSMNKIIDVKRATFKHSLLFRQIFKLGNMLRTVLVEACFQESYKWMQGHIPLGMNLTFYLHVVPSFKIRAALSASSAYRSTYNFICTPPKYIYDVPRHR
jgi:hypothetical protein